MSAPGFEERAALLLAMRRAGVRDISVMRAFEIVPRVTELMTGIYATRKHLKGCYIDAQGCKDGIVRLEGYRKKFNRADGRYIDQPDKANGCTEGADAFRQWAQAKELGMVEEATVGAGSRKTTYYEAEAPDWRM